MELKYKALYLALYTAVFIAIAFIFAPTSRAEAYLYNNQATPIANTFTLEFPMSGFSVNEGVIESVTFYGGATTLNQTLQLTLSDTNENDHLDCTTGKFTMEEYGGYIGSITAGALLQVTIPLTGSECLLQNGMWGIDEHATGSAVVAGNNSYPDPRWFQINGVTQLPNPNTPYGILTSPINGSNQTNSVNFEVKWNVPTTTPSSIVVTFLSLDQDLSSSTYTATSSSGTTQTTNFSINFPYFDDIIYTRIYVYPNLTQTGLPSYISQQYSFNFIANGDLTSVNFGTYTTESEGCSDSVVGALCKITSFLLLPNESAIQNVTSLLSSSTIPLVSNAYTAYSEVTDTLESATTSQATTTLAVEIDIPELGSPITLFSAGLLSQSMGPAKSIFRGVVQVALWLGVLAMTIRSISRTINVTNKDA